MPVRNDGGTWTAEFYESGHAGRLIHKQGFATRAAAQRYERDFIALRKLAGRPLDERLSHLVQLWYGQRGCSLRVSATRLLRTLAVVERLGDPSLVDFDALAWARYRRSRLRVVSRRRVDCEEGYLSAVFAELIGLGAWSGRNPFFDDRPAKSGSLG